MPEAPMPRPRVIAVDGPAASGKTVVGRRLARRLGYQFLDTGSMYRAVTLLALEQGIDTGDADALARIAREMAFRAIEPAAESSPPRVMLDGRDVSNDVRGLEVDRHVSRVSQAPGVRQALVARQRALAGAGDIVMAGRDIGTVVLPDADLKLFLEAPPEERARRRSREMEERGVPVSYDEVLADLRRRDKLDSERELSPLKPAADAVRVDTGALTIDEAVEKLWQLTAER
jgi:cytidylate kinase